MIVRRALICCILVQLCAVVWGDEFLSAADWPQFRGFHFGQAAGNHKLPADIGPSQHVIWKTTLPPGHSSPIVAGSRIFVTSVRDGKQLLTMGLDRATGKVLWEREAPYEKLELINRVGSYAQCSPASNGEFVVSFFGSSGMYCYDVDGRLQWKVAMGPFNDEFGAASSPLIVEDRVIVGQDHDMGSFVAMYNLRTGERIWQTDRSEFSRSYGSPILWTVDGQKQIVIAGMLRVCGYVWDTGLEKWTVRGISRVVCPTPIVGGDNNLFVAAWSNGGDPGERLSLEPFAKAVAKSDANKNGLFEKDEIQEGALKTRFAQCDRDKDGHITRAEYDEFEMLFDKSQNVLAAIRPGGEGDLTETNVSWRYDKSVPFCASPLFHEGRLFMIKDGGILTCLDAATGRLIKTGRVAATGNYYASPVIGDGKLYLFNEQGKLSVVTGQDSWQVIHSVDFGEDVYGSPAIVDGRIYIRTNGHLYCFGLGDQT